MVLVMEDSGGGGVDGWSLVSWGDTPPVHYSASYPPPQDPPPPTPFPLNPTLNQSIVFWEGDISMLRVDAIVHSSDETLTQRCSLSDRLFSKAGSGLVRELNQLSKDCQSGDLIVTNGYKLPARHIFHIVSPKYNPKFITAAENALHNCYRNVLEKANEMKLNSIGICVINSVRRNYPSDEGAHVALRTIRRFLEKRASHPKRVVLAVESCDAGIYEVLLPLYFPRGAREERSAARQLPRRLIGPLGEPLHPERQIRIIDNPQHAITEDESSVVDLCGSMEDNCGQDLDHQRLLGGDEPTPSIHPIISRHFQTTERYERLLRRAKTEDLSEISGIGCLYQCGTDRLGRPLLIFVGKWFRFKDINLDKALLYLIYLLDPLVKSDYVIAYFHTNTSNANYPSLNWLKEVYNILPYKYKKNLKAFYIVHPTLWTKMMSWWFTTFMAPAIKNKVHSLAGIEMLYSSIRPTDLEIPAFITEHDISINGIRYFNYSAGAAIGT